jgi:hypothetical protein
MVGMEQSAPSKKQLRYCDLTATENASREYERRCIAENRKDLARNGGFLIIRSAVLLFIQYSESTQAAK